METLSPIGCHYPLNQYKMNKDKINKWISAIVNEDGHKLSGGSLRTLTMIREEIAKSDEQCSEIELQKEVERLKGLMEYWQEQYNQDIGKYNF